MKRILTAFVILLLAGNAIVSCKKNNPTGNLSLLQHKWNILSLNGEVFRYVGTTQDYYDFRTDNRLYTNTSGKYDTSAYALTGGGSTLLLYHISNGVQSPTAYPFTVTDLSSSRLVMQNHLTPPLYILDSLKR
jgi:hypothetical protein